MVKKTFHAIVHLRSLPYYTSIHTNTITCKRTLSYMHFSYFFVKQLPVVI
jgi:hypothetical protein